METGDRKLNEVKKVTDMAYVPVIMADGSIGQIAKSDLASVVAGVLGNPAGTFANNSVSDCNEISANGYYPFVSKPLNAPEGISTGSVLAFVSSSMRIQYFFTDVEARVYTRRKWYGNDWSAWQRIDNFGYNSLAELSAGVAGVIGVATTEKDGIMPKTQSSKTLTVIQNFENGSIARLKKGTNSAFLLSANTNGYRGGLYYIYIDSQGSAYIKTIDDNLVPTTFYEDSNYVYYIKKYGGTDSISPISNNTIVEIESITSLPSNVSELTKRQVFDYNTLDELAAALKPKLGLS